MKASQDLIISIDRLRKKYRGNVGILGISTTFKPGAINLLIGGNGSGKTTLLKCIMGLVKYEGIIKKEGGQVGYAPETYVMPEFMTITDFLMSIGKIRHDSVKNVRDSLTTYGGIFGLSEIMEKPIGKLSNGTKQKVNLLQAMIGKPRILLFDEPLSSLDPEMKKSVVKLLMHICTKNIVIISTHYPECFRHRLKRIYEIDSGVLVRNGSD